MLNHSPSVELTGAAVIEKGSFSQDPALEQSRQSSVRWQDTKMAPEGTHHLLEGEPLYVMRFQQVLKYHEPGLAPVQDASGAYHVDLKGHEAYPQRFRRTFGYYEGWAAVDSGEGWWHVDPNGVRLSPLCYDWCGNFQDGRCTVRCQGAYFHLTLEGQAAYQARYRYAGDYRDGIAVVQDDSGRHTHIDRDGQKIHGHTYLDLDVYHKGLARARDAYGFFHVDMRGLPVYARRFAAVEPFYNGQARVETLEGSLEVIDEMGNTLLTLRPGNQSPLGRLSSDLVGYWRTQTLRVGVELEVLEALPATAAQVASACRIPVDSSERLLRALWELAVIRPDGEQWQVTERGRFLTIGHPLSLADAARLWGTDHAEAWTELGRALRTGKAVFDRGGRAFFDWLEGRALDVRQYHRAMASYARHDYRALPAAVDLTAHRCVLDAGGGTGELLFHLLRSFPELQGILLDRPEVVALAEVDSSLSERCQLVAADLLEPWPVTADAIVLARVLHDWSDSEAIRILNHAREALSDGGSLYLVELVLEPDSPNGGMLDLNMLVMTGGRERTLQQYRSLLAGAELELREVRTLPSVSRILVARRRHDIR